MKPHIVAFLIIILFLINFSFNYDSLHTWWNYQWYAFPFQFCSTPMYVGLIAALTNSDYQKSRNYWKMLKDKLHNERVG